MNLMRLSQALNVYHPIFRSINIISLDDYPEKTLQNLLMNKVSSWTSMVLKTLTRMIENKTQEYQVKEYEALNRIGSLSKKQQRELRELYRNELKIWFLAALASLTLNPAASHVCLHTRCFAAGFAWSNFRAPALPKLQLLNSFRYSQGK